MANILQQSISWLSGMFQLHASDAITYKRGAQTLTFNATSGRTESPQEEESGVTTVYVSHDFIFPVAFLTFTPATPQRGDTITTADGRVYEVNPPSPREQCFNSDLYNVNFRVHTKQVS